MLVLLLLGGCASMSQRECVSANWQQRGAVEGAKGLPISRLHAHGEACSAVNVVPDAIAYVTGYRQGLREYCTSENGLQKGTQNSEYHDVCPAHLEPQFLTAYIDGLQLKLIQLELDPRTGRSELTHFGHGQPEQSRSSFAAHPMPLTAAQISLTHNPQDAADIRRRIDQYRLRLRQLSATGSTTR